MENGDVVVNVKTGEFGVFEELKDVKAANGKDFAIFQVRVKVDGGSKTMGWKADEIAFWSKPQETSFVVL